MKYNRILALVIFLFLTIGHSDRLIGQSNSQLQVVPTEQYTLKKLAKTPEVLKEASGLHLDKNGILWSHNDGGLPVLYGINTDGKVVKTVHLNHKNSGWEDLTVDEQGFVYVGGFGNNTNAKKDLKIIKIKDPADIDAMVTTGEVIKYTYEDQTEFPPARPKRNFDVDAMIAIGDSLYLFTKNRTSPYDGISKVYVLPNKKGEYVARLVDEVFLGKGPRLEWWVTGAALSPDGNTLALLSHNKVWLLKGVKNGKFSDAKVHLINLNDFTHKAGIVFKNDHELYICDELEMGVLGGQLYLLDISKWNSNY